jgi:hypothetical protein
MEPESYEEFDELAERKDRAWRYIIRNNEVKEARAIKYWKWSMMGMAVSVSLWFITVTIRLLLETWC